MAAAHLAAAYWVADHEEAYWALDFLMVDCWVELREADFWVDVDWLRQARAQLDLGQADLPVQVAQREVGLAQHWLPAADHLEVT